MKKLLLGLTVACTVTVAHGQTQITFQKIYSVGYGTTGMEPSDVKQTTDGNYIITGGLLTPSSGEAVYVSKINSTGNILWSKFYELADEEIGSTINQTSDGGYIIAGTTVDWSQSNYYDFYIIKTDSSGNTLWTKTFGGTDGDLAGSVEETNGGYIIAGTIDYFNIGLSKIDITGNYLWSNIYSTTNSASVSSLNKTNDGGYIITGNGGWGNNYDVTLIKTDSIGNLQWIKNFSGSLSDYGIRAIQIPSGDYIICGYTKSFSTGDYDVLLIKTDSSGNILWSKTYGTIGEENSFDCLVSSTGEIVIAGRIDFYDGLCIKTDSNGNLLWGKRYGGTQMDWFSGIDQTIDGGIILSGYTRGDWMSGNDWNDFYLVKTDTSGNSGCLDTALTLTVATPSFVVTSPSFSVSPYGTLQNSFANISSGSYEIPLCLYVGIDESKPINSPIEIFPNPFSTQTTLQTDNLLHNATLTVDNCFGQTVAQIKNINGQTVTFNRGNLASGLYFVRLTEENKTIAIDKLIVTD